MGGVVALTIRVSAEKQYRGSCWTNVLPEGLWAAEFYVDIDMSKRHAWAWVQQLLEHRRAKPELEEIWGGHDMLAPLGYGIVIIDYVTSTLVSAQGYSASDWMIPWPHDEDKLAKWKILDAAGLLRRPGPWPEEKHESAYIQLPFQNVRCSDLDTIDEAMMRWADDTFGLSEKEKATWLEFIRQRDE